MYPSDKWTDKELESLEKRIAKVYQEAANDVDKEVKEYFAKFKLRDKEMKKLVDAGEVTKAEYQQWRLTQIGRGQRFEALRDKLAERYTSANETANAYVNDATPSIYSINRNYEAYTIEKSVGSCDFTLWDESTVRRLIVEQPDIMPFYPAKRALDRGIDLAYGKDQITKRVTSGILRGLAPGKIANELMAGITTMSRESAVRAARTGITAAQNAGRMDSYVAAEKMGITIRRRWVCTKDSRTRFDHGMADGQIVEGTKTPFVVGGYKMMFPGDKSLGAPGHEIYNCRCTTRTVEKDGIEAEPRQMRVRNPEWEEAKAAEDKAANRLEKLKERESAETDPDKRKQLRQERIKAQKELTAATKKRQGIDKNVVVNEMTYSDWKKWKETGVKPIAKSVNSGTMAAKAQRFKSDVTQALEARKISYNQVYKRDETKTLDEIISAVAGGDNTRGSCASVGLAYIGQKCGYNVLDFRDGASRDWFSSKLNKLKMWDAVGAEVIKVDKYKTNLTNAKHALKQLVGGKEYYMSAGGHAAIVRKNADGVLQYLELQSPDKSGWTNFESGFYSLEERLKYRFGCSASSRYYSDVYLTDIDQLKDNKEFFDVLGYLNTAENEQRKGTSGTIK
jgi:hypothetical protein